jgi:cell division septal protein FtsQ
LYLVDDMGTIIDEFGPRYRAFDLPVVDGLLTAASAAGGTADAARLKVTTQFLEAIGAAPEFAPHVAQIDVTDAHDVVVILDSDPVLLHLGDRQFVERLRRYVELAPTLHDHFKAIDSVDLRFDERAIVRKGR